jgi:hypothetical protein
MWDRGFAVGGFYTSAPIFITLLATIVVSLNATIVGAITETTGDTFPPSPAEVSYASSASPVEDELRSHLPDCSGQTTTSNPRQQVPLATYTDSTTSLTFRRKGVGDTDVTDQTEPLAIVLRVRDTARVPEDVLTNAQGDVTRIYREAGVEILWPRAESLSAESNAVRRAALTVAILTQDKAEQIGSGGADSRVGFAARTADGKGQLVYVIYDRVQLLTGGNGLRRARMLAIAIAHEIGHLLLPDKGHSLTGLMRAYWTHADLRLVQRELIFFTPGQSRLLRNRISGSRYRITGEALQKHRCTRGLR